MKSKIKIALPVLERRGSPSRREKKEIAHGNWKLVYADFVTVLMAFFIVVWIMLFDLVSERDKLDTSCFKTFGNRVATPN